MKVATLLICIFERVCLTSLNPFKKLILGSNSNPEIQKGEQNI